MAQNVVRAKKPIVAKVEVRVSVFRPESAWNDGDLRSEGDVVTEFPITSLKSMSFDAPIKTVIEEAIQNFLEERQRMDAGAEQAGQE